MTFKARIRSLVCGAGFVFGLATICAADLPPAAPPPKPVHFPAPVVRALPNGFRVAVIERHALPIITLRLVVRSGAEADPPELPGEAQLLAALLNQGTTKHSAQEIAQTIDRIGGTIDTGADWDNSYIALSVLSDHTELAFDLAAEMAIHPAFASAEIERQRQQALSALSVAWNDPAYVADAVFGRLTFAGTPYGHPADGTQAAVRRITSEDIRKFYARNYRPSNCVLAVVGDIRPDQAFDLADRFFSRWQEDKSSSPASRPAEAEAAAGARETAGKRRIVVIDKPDAVQTEIRMGNRAIPRNHPDYLPLTVANQILGGLSTNRLSKSLRTDHGLTYSASSELMCYQSAGSWQAKTFTRTSETMKSVRIVLDEMKRLRERTISGLELGTTQRYLTGHLALEVESAQDVATQTLNLLIYDLPLDYWNTFPKKIDSVADEDVLNATRRFLDPERNVIVLVGNAGSFSKDLKKLGDVRVIPLQNVDLTSLDLESHAAASR